MKLRAKVKVSMTRGVIGWVVYDITGTMVQARAFLPMREWEGEIKGLGRFSVSLQA